MLSIARQRAIELGREVDLREGDAQALAFPDASFDTVVCTLALCGVPDDRVAIAEMHRVLRPGGKLLLLDHIGSHHRLIRLGQRLLEKLTLRMLGDYQTRRPFPRRILHGHRISGSAPHQFRLVTSLGGLCA